MKGKYKIRIKEYFDRYVSVFKASSEDVNGDEEDRIEEYFMEYADEED